MPNREITREVLYDLVWSAPSVGVAPQLGISDVGLAKLCRKHRVPKPPRGYWARKKADRIVRRPPLPELRESQRKLETITLGSGHRPSAELIQSGPVADQKRHEADPKNRIRVPQRISRAHPLVQKTRERLKSGRAGYFSRYRGSHPHLNVRVSRDAVARSLRILNTLILALERRGFMVSVTSDRVQATVVSVLDETIEIRLFEKGKRVERPPSEWELSWDRKFYGEERHYYENVPSGRLALEICEYWAPRKLWSDGKRQRLENCLNGFVVGLVATSVAKKEWQRQREEDERLRQQQLRKRLEEKQRRQEEENRLRKLSEMVDSWVAAGRLRLFLEAVRRTAEDRGMLTAAGKDWLEWAHHHADNLDPLPGLVMTLERCAEP